MTKTCKLDSPRNVRDLSRSFELDSEIDGALLEAIVATRAKIDQAFAGRKKISAKLKTSSH